MPVNPLQGGFNPIALEHQEAAHQETAQQTQKTQQDRQDSPVNNAQNTQIVQQQGEPIPIQQSQESQQTNYTDRESQGQQQDETEAEVEEMEAKTKKSVEDLQRGLEQVADGIEQLKELSQHEKGMPTGLDARLQKISAMGQKLVIDIEQTVEKAIDTMLGVGQSFFEIAVTELTAVRVSIDELIADLVKRQARIPTPEVRDNSAKAQTLRKQKQHLGRLLNDVSDATNVMLEQAEGGLRQLLEGNEAISGGFRMVNNGDADGFKRIEAGFRALFASISVITDATANFRVDVEFFFKGLTLFPDQLQKELGSREALGLPERLSAVIWQSPERVEQCWRALQGNLGVLSAAMAKFGEVIEANFEQAARAVIDEGQVAVDCVNTDLGDIKEEAKQTLSPSAAHAVDQILEGADQVENALDSLVDTGEKKHNTIKRGSVNPKLPSHFNVRL